MSGDKYVSFHAARDANVVINEVAADFPEVAKALERLDPKVLRDFADALSQRMNWGAAETFSLAVNTLSMEALENFTNVAHLVDSRRLDDFSRAVSTLEGDTVAFDLGRTLEDLKQLLPQLSDAKIRLSDAKRDLAETVHALSRLDVVALADYYTKKEAGDRRTYATRVTELEEELSDWKARCLYACLALAGAGYLLLRLA